MSDLGTWGTANPGGEAGQNGAEMSRVSTSTTPWPVAAFGKSIKDYVEKLGYVWVEGELAKVSDRGNQLFAQLRDLSVEAAIEIHSFDSRKIEPGLQQGDRVVALVKPNFWVKNGKLSNQVLEMRKVGLGDLLERIERLRAQLASEGLTQVKQPLPFLPNLIGLITGKDSDAEKDVLNNAKLRWPEVRFRVINTKVQGDAAVPEIVAAIKSLDADPEVDVIIVARGGGSFTDLLAFSDETLVRAAAATHKPIVSAIGHDADRPVLDDVADLRASTPTDAAKRVVPDVVQERADISAAIRRIHLRIAELVNGQLGWLEQLRSRPSLANPYAFVEKLESDLMLARQAGRTAFANWLGFETQALGHLSVQVKSLSPQSTLDRGYAVVRTDAGAVITDAAAVKPGTKLKLRVAKGELNATTE